MEIVLFWFIGLSTVIALFALQNDKIEKGFKPNAKDGDRDGLVQEGTKWERKAKK
jgi:hypothetical protein